MYLDYIPLTEGKRLSFKIEEVKELPEKAYKGRIKAYDDLIKTIKQKPKGFYRVQVTGKKPKSLHVALLKRLEKEEKIKVRMRGDQVFLEVTE